MHARLAWPGCGRPSTPAWRRPASGQPWPLVSRPSSSSWPPSRSRCWCPATARRAARARRPTRRRAIRQERRERRLRCRRPRRGRVRPRCLQHPRRPLTRPRRLRPRIPPRLRRSPPRLRPVPRRAAHPDTQGITAAEPGTLMQRPTAPNTQICAPRETSAKKPHHESLLCQGFCRSFARCVSGRVLGCFRGRSVVGPGVACPKSRCLGCVYRWRQSRSPVALGSPGGLRPASIRLQAGEDGIADLMFQRAQSLRGSALG
jgi:hypothetical protein